LTVKQNRRTKRLTKQLKPIKDRVESLSATPKPIKDRVESLSATPYIFFINADSKICPYATIVNKVIWQITIFFNSGNISHLICWMITKIIYKNGMTSCCSAHGSCVKVGIISKMWETRSVSLYVGSRGLIPLNKKFLYMLG
jgi:hypothetical protein